MSVRFIAPHPTYESCPPTSKNIAVRFDDLNEAIQTSFIPYADEEEFDALEYAKECQSFSWQVDWQDPDCETYLIIALLLSFLTRPVEVIQLETARRLHFGHGLTFAEIDDLSFLRQLRVSNESGLLWDTSQRFDTFVF